MIPECTAIIVIILLIAGIIVRKGRPRTALAILPLAIVPFSYIISGYIAHFINIWQRPDIFIHMSLGVVMIGALITGILMGIIATRIKAKANRRAYLVLCGGYTVALIIVMVLRIIGI